MQENLDPNHKFWILKELVNEAQNRCQEISKSGHPISPEFMVGLMGVVAEAAEKVSHTRWLDNYGLYHGVDIYKQIIKNL